MLIDTRVIIDYLRFKGDKSKSWFFKLVDDDDISCSLLTVAELYAGKSVWESDKAGQELKLVLSGIDKVSITESMAKKAGELRANKGLSLADAIIAATALELGEKLATVNIKDFKVVEGLRLVER